MLSRILSQSFILELACGLIKMEFCYREESSPLVEINKHLLPQGK